MKIKRKLISLFLAVTMIVSLVSCSKPDDESLVFNRKKDGTEEEFLAFTEELYLSQITSSTLDLHYQIAHPENYGIDYFEPTFGVFYQEDSEDEEDALYDYCMKELRRYDSDSFSKRSQVIYESLTYFLRCTNKLNQYEFYYETLSPTSGFQAMLPILLSEYQFYNEDDITDYIKLLSDTPRYFQEIADYQRKKSAEGFFMSDRTAEEIIEQCETFTENPSENLLIVYFDEKIDTYSMLSTDEKTLLKEQNREAVLNDVIPAYQILIDVLEELKGTGQNDAGLARYKDGTDYYEAYARYRTGSDKSIPQMKKALENQIKHASRQITLLFIQYPDLIDDVEDASFPLTDPNEIIDTLKINMSADFPLLENADHTIKYVHESLKDSLNPAMYIIPPIDEYNQNYVYINLDDDADYSSLFTTVAHESYPGHLYQTVYFMQTNPELIQNLIGPLGYSEGWGMYAEIYSYAFAGLPEHVYLALQANMEYVYCLYALADIGIHYEGWTLDEFGDFWNSQGIPGDEMDDFYQYMVTEPGAYLPYTIGYIEIMELKTKAQNALGDRFNVKNFHKFLLEIGSAPFSVINTHFTDWLAIQ